MILQTVIQTKYRVSDEMRIATVIIYWAEKPALCLIVGDR